MLIGTFERPLQASLNEVVNRAEHKRFEKWKRYRFDQPGLLSELLSNLVYEHQAASLPD